jgi:cytochrome c-type biogenesis protein CcmF
MSTIGLVSLLVAFAACAVSLVCLGVAHILYKIGRVGASDLGAWAGRLASVVTALALTAACGVLVYCFMSGDNTIEYVLENRSDATGNLAWLYKLSGLWAGRAGSLLLWAWLISVFNCVLVFATRKNVTPLDNGALAVAQLVLVAFVAVLLFSESNMPFTVTSAKYLNSDGTLTASASVLGMNSLLEHWAMAIHPPTLFIGYAGFTVPFAYALAALITNNSSARWVERSQPYVMFSWLFLTAGIGLGAVWAYVVLGWGGYWGWDAVENASLLPWLMGVVLIHSFTVYRKHGAFKRWSVMAACLAFASVVLGTFITRSGIVQSVHAFEGDTVSLVLFGALIVASAGAGAVGLIVRRKSFGTQGGEGVTGEGAIVQNATAAQVTPSANSQNAQAEAFASKSVAYYLNNLLLVLFAVILTYMTVAPALPSALPFGGQALSAGSYNAVARPLGIVYCALIAVCPLLGWAKTDGRAFWRRARVPLVCAVVLFALLMVYFCTYLLPSYNAIIGAGGSAADGLTEQGPAAYYNGIAVAAFAVASLLFFNAAFMIARTVKAAAGAGAGIRAHLATLGGAVCHMAMSIILVGLVGSSMYVTEATGYINYDSDTNTASNTLTCQNFELVYASNSVDVASNNDDITYTVVFDVYLDGQLVGQVSPAVQVIQSTQQQKLVAGVIHLPSKDLFVTYKGVNSDGAFSIDALVNPAISAVWAGFGLLMVGAVITLFAKRGRQGAPANSGECSEGCGAPAGRVAVTGEADADGKGSESEQVTPSAPLEPSANAEAEAEAEGAK